jgi:hypothetical protein
VRWKKSTEGKHANETSVLTHITSAEPHRHNHSHSHVHSLTKALYQFTITRTPISATSTRILRTYPTNLNRHGYSLDKYTSHGHIHRQIDRQDIHAPPTHTQTGQASTSTRKKKKAKQRKTHTLTYTPRKRTDAHQSPSKAHTS